MKNLWAPWRMEFIYTLREETECFLCAAARAEVPAPDASSEMAQQPSLVIHRGKRCFAVLNRYPYSNGHLLIAPLKHKADISDLDDETLLEIMTTARDAKKALTEVCAPDAFNIGFNLGKDAGAGLMEHLHLHVVPRWRGDTNFMPVLADVKVIPQALCAMCGPLRAKWPRHAKKKRGS